jgi:CspA family cold shock protein
MSIAISSARETGLTAAAALQKPQFCSSLAPAIGFWRPGRSLLDGRDRIGSSKKPGCGATCSEHIGVDFDLRLKETTTMQKGAVKWFNPTKGYGFIRPQTGDKDVFVHISAVERAGLSSLNEGQVVEYELVTNRGKTSAENLKIA